MKTFLIPSLLLAGFNTPSSEDMFETMGSKADESTSKYLHLLERKLPFTLAGHSSHGSHGSHGSHRSSSVSAPRTVPPVIIPKTKPAVPSNRNKNSTPPSSVLPSSPAIDLPKLKGNSAQFQRIVMRVQMYLYAFGYYTGSIDGRTGQDTQTAIVKYQKNSGLKITGVVDDTLLKAMNVSIK